MRTTWESKKHFSGIPIHLQSCGVFEFAREKLIQVDFKNL